MQLAFGVLLVVLLTELINLIGKTHFTAMVTARPPTCPPACLMFLFSTSWWSHADQQFRTGC